jgi:hypothetical protein
VRTFSDRLGRSTGGFAVLAWPSPHGNSGSMSFLVSHQGLDFETDLGPQTRRQVQEILDDNPASSWSPVRD